MCTCCVLSLPPPFPLHQAVKTALYHRCLSLSLFVICRELVLTLSFVYVRFLDGTFSNSGSLKYNSSRAVCYYLPDRPPLLLEKGRQQTHPPPSTMVTPFLVQNSASQVSLPPGDFHSGLKSKISISSIANAMRKRKIPTQTYPVHPKSFMKSDGPCTLSLNADHEASSGLPMFSSGAVISGSLELSKISRLLHSIQITVIIPTGVPACGNCD